LVLGAFQETQLDLLIQLNLEFVISSSFKAKIAAERAFELGATCSVHVEVDTGMRRTGVRSENARALIDLVQNNPVFHLKGVFSHFVSSETPNDPVARMQIEEFLSLKQKVGGDILWHLANSGGVVYYPESHLDLVRPGLLCYGVSPQNAIPEIQPVLALKAKISYFKVVRAGEGISYGHLHRTTEQTRVVTVPVGYGDGYRRDFSNRMSVLIRGKRHKIVGAICMDQFMVDIGNEEAYVGEEVVLLGRQEQEELSFVEMAHAANTDPREILVHFNERIPRLYSKK
jgi:alanine racemase